MLYLLGQDQVEEITAAQLGQLGSMTGGSVTYHRLKKLTAGPDRQVALAIDGGDVLAAGVLVVNHQLTGTKAWIDVAGFPDRRAETTSVIDCLVERARGRGAKKIDARRPLPGGVFLPRETSYFRTGDLQADTQNFRYDSSIRRLRIEHVTGELITELNVSLRAGSGRIKPRLLTSHRLVQVLGDPTRYVYALRDGAGALVGLATLIIQYQLGEAFALIEDIYGRPKPDSEGIRRRLVSHALLEAKNLGLKFVELTSGRDTQAARRLYEPLGFHLLSHPTYRYAPLAV